MARRPQECRPHRNQGQTDQKPATWQACTRAQYQQDMGYQAQDAFSVKVFEGQIEKVTGKKSKPCPIGARLSRNKKDQ